MKSGTKFTELESLRGLAALLVVFFHIPNFNPILNLNIFKNLDLMVDLFFVLSGFVIYSAYSERIQTKTELIKFQFLRFGRLYPIHIIFVILFLGFEIARYILNLTGHSFSNSQAFVTNDFVAFIEQVVLIQSFHPGHALTFNIVAWSISIEFYTYILFGLIVLYCKHYKNYIFSILAFCSLTLMFLDIGPDLLRICRCLTGFFIGCIISKLANNKESSTPKYLSLFLFIVLFTFIAFNTNSLYRPAIYFLSAGVIFYLVSVPSGLLNRLLNKKVLVYLGTISYSMYMSHISVLYVANYLVKNYKFPTLLSRDGQMIPSLNLIELLVYILLSFVLVIGVSHFLYNVVEKPLREKSRDFVKRLG